MPYLKSFLNIGLHQIEEEGSVLWGANYFNICTFDYHVFDKASRQPVLAQYNVLIANDMLAKGSQLAFENEAVVILKNTAGDDCIEERSF